MLLAGVLQAIAVALAGRAGCRLARALQAREWDAYLSGQYVCLRCVTPASIRRKTALVTAIEQALAQPRPEQAWWLEQLHAKVDELDTLEPPFAPDYDRLRFGGPSSRSKCIDDVRARFSRPGRPAGAG